MLRNFNNYSAYHCNNLTLPKIVKLTGITNQSRAHHIFLNQISYKLFVSDNIYLEVDPLYKDLNDAFAIAQSW